MNVKLALWTLMATSLVADILTSPIQFPEDSNQGKSVEPYAQTNIEAKFHHSLLHKHKKKKRKRKKDCYLALHRGRDAGGANPEGRFFFVPLINYYNTDIHVYNGPVGGKPGTIDPCSALVGGAGSVISTGGSAVSGLGGLLPGGNGGKPPPPTLGGGTPAGGDGGDDSDEDYDYSDGGDSDTNTSDGSTFFSNGVNTLNGIASSAPGILSNVFNSVTNGIRPLFEGSNRYFDYYIARPFNRSFSQLFRWF